TRLGADLIAAYPDGGFPAHGTKAYQADVTTDGWYTVSQTSEHPTGEEQQAGQHDTGQPPSVLFRDPTVAADFTHIAGLSLQQIRNLYATGLL
ncbi:MAG: hypothetical protein ACRCSP_05710, partial [Rhodoglobus sp.]